MNRNFKRKPNNANFPFRLIIGIIFASLVFAPILLPFAIIGIIVFVISKNLKNNDTSSSKTRSVNKKIAETRNTNDTSHVMDKEIKVVQSDSQKRLESLKSLYDNGFMDRDEYEERRKKI